MKILRISLLGAWQVRYDEQELIAFPKRKELALLAWLATEQAHAHSRDRLGALFWPDESMETARKNLRVILSRLQTRLGDNPSSQPFLLSDRNRLQFNPACDHWLDVLEFQRLIEGTRQHGHAARATCPICRSALQEAVEFYGGNFLDDFYLDDCQEFEEWITIRREQFHRMVIECLDDLVTGILSEVTAELKRSESTDKKLRVALRAAQRLVELDALNERARRHLMRLLDLSGERSAAIAQFNALRHLLHQELALEPEAETLALLEHIRQTEGETGRQGEAFERFLPAHPLTPSPPHLFTHSSTSAHNLPTSLTPFIGREAEITQIGASLTRPGHRLISLVGVGGIGKTRLAIEIASRHLLRFADGVFFVPLVALSQANDVPTAILAAMQRMLKSEQKSAYEQMLDILRQKQLLLILDNLEHLLQEDAPQPGEPPHPTLIDLIVDILHSAPAVTLLVTSREQLDLQAEDLYLLNGLPVPSPTKNKERIADGADFQRGERSNQEVGQEIMQPTDFAGIQLFVERAQRRDKSFALTPANRTDVIRICQTVEGIPLAIELAVTWLAHLSCAAIASELEESHQLLRTNRRDVRAQHRSMEIVFATSWNLLTSEEQQLFAQLSIFAGTFTLEAARSIAGPSGRSLTQLRHKSVLRSEGLDRVQLHQLLRQFAAEMLHSHFDATATGELANRHSDFYLHKMAEQQELIPRIESQAEISAITLEMDNVRAAWRWAVAHASFAQIDAASEGVASYYSLLGLAEEGEQLFRSAITMARSQELAPNQEPSDRATLRSVARLLSFHADFLLTLANFEAAEETARESLRLAISIGDQETEALANVNLAVLLAKTNNLALARPYYEQGCQLAEHLKKHRLLVVALNARAWVATAQTDFADAQATYEHALQICRQQLFRRDESNLLYQLGQLYFTVGVLNQAQHCFEESIAIARQLGLRWMEGRTLAQLGALWDRLGDFSQAAHYYQAALGILQEYGERWLLGLVYSNLGVSSDYCGNYQAALHYTQQAIQIHQELKSNSHLHLFEMNLSLFYHHLQDNLSAERHGRLALEATRQTGDQVSEGYSWTIWGHALSELGRLADAANAYQQTLNIHQQSGSVNLITEAWAGLARLALAQNDLEQACAWVEKILHFLETESLDSAEEPGRVYLTCYQLLHHVGDPRATAILQRAYSSIQMRATKISDETTRHSFLHNVAAHRALLLEFEAA